jgi:hypothetical protein
MPQHVTVTVPAQDAELVLEALLAVYAARATHLAEQVADDARLREARAELAEAGRMLDAFGWERGRRVRATELAGSEWDVGEVLRLALSDAHDALGAVIEDYHQGRAALEDLTEASERLRAMVGRFAAFEAQHAL